MKHTLLICDSEYSYAQKIAEYINTREGFPFETRFIMENEDMHTYSETKMGVDIVLSDEEMLYKTNQFFNPEKILVLSGDMKRKNMESGLIYKYQNVDNIIKEILLHAAQRKDLGNLVSRKNQMKMIGFFSPVGRSGRTTLALTIGQILAKEYKTLYVDMESYSDTKEILGANYSMDLSDLIYSMNNSPGDISVLIRGVGVTNGALDIMPSMGRYSDLISISPAEWLQFFGNLEYGTDYEYIILDLSTSVQGLMQIISMCNKLVVTGQDKQNKCVRIEEFRKELGENGIIDEMIIFTEVPKKTDIESCTVKGININNAVGDRAKELLKEIVA